MAGLFMCLGFSRGSLGFDLGSQSWIPSLPSLPSLPLLPLLPLLPSGIPSWIHWFPAELHLGFHLGSIGFHLGSIWDSILDALVSS